MLMSGSDTDDNILLQTIDAYEERIQNDSFKEYQFLLCKRKRNH